MCPGFRLAAGGSIVFSAVSVFFSREADDNTDDSVGAGREKTTTTVCFVDLE